MPGSNVYLSQYIYSYFSQPTVTYSSEAVLDTPLLLSPAPGMNLCGGTPAFSVGTGSGITVAWTAIVGADFYILQWCKNSSFSGPTVSGVKVATNAYELLYKTDIRLGETYHWRVMAYSTSGAVSAKSEAWSFTWDCGEFGSSDDPGSGDGTGSPPQDSVNCAVANATVKIDGPRQVMCCDRSTWHVDIKFDCENELQIADVTWAIDQYSGNGHTIEEQDAKHIVVSTSSEASEIFEITANVLFVNPTSPFGYYFDAYGYLDQFYCSDKFKVFSDCYSGKPNEKPWLKIYYEPFPGIIHYIDPDYHDVSFGDSYRTIASTQNRFYLPVLDGGLLAIGPVVLVDYNIYYEHADNPCEEGIDAGGRTAWQLEARVHVPVGCGLNYNNTFGIYVDPYLAGDGLYFRDCQFHAYAGTGGYGPGCGLILEDTNLAVNAEVLAGQGLSASVPCVLDIHYGCGLMIGETNELFFYAYSLNLFGLSPFDGGCGLVVDIGCGLNFNEDFQIYVDTELLAGQGLRYYPEDGPADCKLHVLAECHIDINDDNFLYVNLYSVVGDATGDPKNGLKVFPPQFPPGCDTLGVAYSCGLNLDSLDQSLVVDLRDLAGPGLYAYHIDGNCYGLQVDMSYLDNYISGTPSSYYMDVITDIYCSAGYLYKVTESIRVLSF